MANSFINLLTPDFTKIDEVYNILLKQYNPDNIEKTELMFIDSVNFENVQNHEMAEKLSEYLNVKKSKLQYQNIDYFNHYIKTKRFGFIVYYSYTLNKYSFDSKIKSIIADDFQNLLNERKELYFYIFNKLSGIEKTAFKSKFCDSLEKLKSFQKESFFIELITDLINVIEKDYLKFKKSTEAVKPDEKYKTQILFKVGLLFAKGDMNKYFDVNNKNTTVMKNGLSAPKIAKELKNDSYDKYILATINNYKTEKNIFNRLDMMNNIISHCEAEKIPVDPYFLSRLPTE